MLLYPYSAQVSELRQKPVLVTDNFHYNLAIGNNLYSQGTYSNHAELLGKELGINFHGPEGTEYLLEYMREHPEHAVGMFAKKTALWFIGAAGPRHTTNYCAHPLSPMLAYYRIGLFLLGLYGGFLLPRLLRFHLLFIGIVASGVYIAFFADYRFTLAVIPHYALACAMGLIKLFADDLPAPSENDGDRAA